MANIGGFDAAILKTTANDQPWYMPNYCPFPNVKHVLVRDFSAAEMVASFDTPLTILSAPADPDGNALKLTITGFKLSGTSALANFTSFVIQDTTDTPVVVSTVALAALDGAKCDETTATTVVNGAGFAATLAAGKGIAIKTTGGSATAAGTAQLILEYTVSA